MKNHISVLYVDDEPINLMLFKTMIKSKLEVKTAESAIEGLKILEECPETKVVISDMKMPYMNGIEFITKAKKTYPSIIFFILTGYEITTEIENGLQKGLIKKYFQKPFKMQDIYNEIQSIFNDD
jgi:two-component system, response regulator, stage 0 sporulation protein F